MHIGDKILNRRTFVASLALVLGACTKAPEPSEGEAAPTKSDSSKSSTSDTTEKQDETETTGKQGETESETEMAIDQEPYLGTWVVPSRDPERETLVLEEGGKGTHDGEDIRWKPSEDVADAITIRDPLGGVSWSKTAKLIEGKLSYVKTVDYWDDAAGTDKSKEVSTTTFVKAEDAPDTLPVAYKETIDEYEESYVICFYEPEERMKSVPLDEEGEEIEYRPYQVFSGDITNTCSHALTVFAEIDPMVSYTDEYGERETADYFIDIYFNGSWGKKGLASVKPGDTREFTYTMPAFDPELKVRELVGSTIYKELAYEGIGSVDFDTMRGDDAAQEWYAYPDEYEISDERIEFDGDGGCEVTGTITNNTNYYWERGTISYSFYWDESLETNAEGSGGTGYVDHLAPGASADFEIRFQPYSISSDDELHWYGTNACVFDCVMTKLDRSKEERPDWLMTGAL